MSEGNTFLVMNNGMLYPIANVATKEQLKAALKEHDGFDDYKIIGVISGNPEFIEVSGICMRLFPEN